MRKVILGILALVLLTGGTIATVAARSNPYEPAPIIAAEVVEVAEVPQVVSAEIRTQVIGNGLEAMLAQRNDNTLSDFGFIDFDELRVQLQAIDRAALVSYIREFDREIISWHIRDFDMGIIIDFVQDFDMDAAASYVIELVEQLGYGQWLFILDYIDLAEYIRLFNDNRPLIIEWIEDYDVEELITEIENFDIEPILEWIENVDIDELVADLEVLWAEALEWIEWFESFDIDAFRAELELAFAFIAQLEDLGINVDAIIAEINEDIIRQQVQRLGFGGHEDKAIELFNRFLR